MIKILIACDNDNTLFSKLNKMDQIEIIKLDKNIKIIIEDYKKNNPPDMLILDKNILTDKKIVKKIYQLSSNKNLIISVTNSRTYLCFDKFSLLLDLIKILENLTDTTLENSIYDMLWHLRFNLYSKGTIYLKDAIIIAYYNNILLYDTNKLIKQVAQKYNLDEKNIRNNIDNSLNRAFTYENLKYDIEFFKGYYDGRKISLKYFISLAVHYIQFNSNSNFSNILFTL